MILVLTIIFILICTKAYIKINKYLRFVKEFINMKEIYEIINNDKYQILFCTKEQLENNFKIILKFYNDNKVINSNVKSLKILCDEKLLNSDKEYVEFFKKYRIDNIPSILLIEDKINKSYVTLA